MSRQRGGRGYDEEDVRIRPNPRGSRPRTKDRPKHADASWGLVVTKDRGRWGVVLDDEEGLRAAHLLACLDVVAQQDGRNQIQDHRPDPQGDHRQVQPDLGLCPGAICGRIHACLVWCGA